MNTLTNIQIDEMLKNIKNYYGCFSKDEIRTKLKEGFYVINLQNRNDGDGTHWCILYITNHYQLWFDSYGFICPENIDKLCNKLVFSEKMVQSLDSSSCGYYVILFILNMNQYNINDRNLINKYNDFINLFSKDTKLNERILKNELIKYNIIM
jgi:hypothetical protein